jgi:hypothetical protein
MRLLDCAELQALMSAATTPEEREKVRRAYRIKMGMPVWPDEDMRIA